MERCKRITLTALPKSLTGDINPYQIVKEKSAAEYLERMKPFIFGKGMLKSAEKVGLDIFSFIFVQDKPFHDYAKKKTDRILEGGKDLVRLAILANLLYKGKAVRMIPLHPDGEDIIVGEVTLLQLNLIDTSYDYRRKNVWLEKKAQKNAKKGFSPNKRALHFSETIELSVVKYYMKRVLSEKALIDKVNFRRFSIGLRLNNRPITLEEMTALLRAKKEGCYFDFTDVTIRLGLSALYAVTYKDFDFADIYSVSYVFSEKSSQQERRLTEAASELLDLLYNGNGIEIAGVFVRMIQTFVNLPLPPLKSVDLMQICKNYTVYYAVTSLAYILDGAFSKNQEFKSYIRHKMISNYWAVYQRILNLKQFSTVVSLCHVLSKLDLQLYRDLPSYQETLILEFGKAEDAVRSMNEDV